MWMGQTRFPLLGRPRAPGSHPQALQSLRSGPTFWGHRLLLDFGDSGDREQVGFGVDHQPHVQTLSRLRRSRERLIHEVVSPSGQLASASTVGIQHRPRHVETLPPVNTQDGTKPMTRKALSRLWTSCMVSSGFPGEPPRTTKDLLKASEDYPGA